MPPGDSGYHAVNQAPLGPGAEAVTYARSVVKLRWAGLAAVSFVAWDGRPSRGLWAPGPVYRGPWAPGPITRPTSPLRNTRQSRIPQVAIHEARR